MPKKWEEKVFLFRNMSLTLFNNDAILYLDDVRVRYSSLRGSSNAVPARSSRARNTQYKDKPDMIEVDTTYSWQMPCGVDAGDFCASVPGYLSRTQSEFGLACVNEVSASKQANTARLQLTLRRPVISRSRHKPADLTLNQQLFLSCIRSVSSRPDFRSAESINTYYADMGISIPVPAFFVPGTHIPVDNLSTN